MFVRDGVNQSMDVSCHEPPGREQAKTNCVIVLQVCVLRGDMFTGYADGEIVVGS